MTVTALVAAMAAANGPDTQTSFTKINPEVPQVSNGSRQWSHNFRQYQVAPPLGPVYARCYSPDNATTDAVVFPGTAGLLCLIRNSCYSDSLVSDRVKRGAGSSVGRSTAAPSH